MANNVANVVVGKPLVTGGVLVAPLGTALPTDAVTALNVAFVATGYLTDAGVVKSEKRNTGMVYAWGGDSIAMTKKGYDVTVKVALAEFLNAAAQTVVYGSANVTTTVASTTHGNQTTVKGTSQTPPHNMWAFEIFNDGGKKLRLVFPNLIVQEIGDTTFKDDQVAALQLTLESFPDASGNYFYQYTDDGQHT